jgi:hypothetical protein
MKKKEDKSPFEKLMNTLITSSGVKKVEDIHPQDFKIIMDAIVSLFFEHDQQPGKKLGLEGMTDYKGVKIEFSPDVKYPCIRRDRLENYKIIVLPEDGLREDSKVVAAKEALKEFDCLETIEKYELCLRIFNSFSEQELSTLAREYDPYKRDSKQLEERLLERAKKREESK